MSIRFQNLARHPDIGTNSYLLEFGDTRFVLDAGTHPKHPGYETLPLFNELDSESLDAIFISHPHLDHIGALPCLSRDQQSAPVIMSEGTKQAGRALLHNSVNVMTALRKELDEPAYPLYSHRQIDGQYKSWMTQDLRKPFSLGSIDRVKCEFFHAGHVLGAVGISFEYEGRSVFYTGDVHFEDQTVTKAAEFPTENIDDLIMESTRGDSPRDPEYCRDKEKAKFGQIIAETLAGGGAVLIPVFAFGKTQEVALMLKELMDEGEIPMSPVHIGGLSSKMTAISDEYSDSNERRHQNFKILQEYPDLRVMPKGRSEPEYQPGHIYAISSGMMSENTVSNRFAKHIITNPKDALLFVGYADPDTPAGKIQSAQPGDSVVLDEKKGRKFPLKCHVQKFDFSGHASRRQLVDYAVKVNPKRIILVHGDVPAKQWMQQEISSQLPHAEVIIPTPGQSINLD
ncbi:MAG: MBL fold metallo-hydrolase [Verrucomicrobiales bacterium]|nr:MBL fold metallo-hydrolase [Verrucomicrobiales bacterium]